MPFHKGESGNPAGRPVKQEIKRVRKDTEGSVLGAWREVCAERPELVQDAIERGLEGKKALGYLELGAKLSGELGRQGESAQQINIIFASPLDSSKLNTKSLAVHEVRAILPPKLEDAEILEVIPKELDANQSLSPR